MGGLHVTVLEIVKSNAFNSGDAEQWQWPTKKCDLVNMRLWIAYIYIEAKVTLAQTEKILSAGSGNLTFQTVPTVNILYVMLKILYVSFIVVNKCSLHWQNISNKYIFVHERKSEVLFLSFKNTHCKPNLTQYLLNVLGTALDIDTLFWKWQVYLHWHVMQPSVAQTHLCQILVKTPKRANVSEFQGKQ